MPNPNPVPKRSHKLGPNRNEFAKKVRTKDPNFAQSRDVHEDRGQRQAQSERVRQSVPPNRPGPSHA